MAHKTISLPRRSVAAANHHEQADTASSKRRNTLQRSNSLKLNYSTLLSAHPSFMGGIARLLDFGNTFTEYNLALSAEQSDMLALLADQRAILHDFQIANRPAKRTRNDAKA